MNRIEHTPTVRSLPLLTAVLTLALVWLAAAASPAQGEERPDKALGRPASASSVEQPRNGGACNVPGTCEPGLANDGRTETRWSSEYTDAEFWQVDLGAPRLVDTVALTWEPAYPQRYLVSTSLDGLNFSTAAEQEINLSTEEWLRLQVTRRISQATAFAARSARFVRISSVKRASKYGISIWDASVFGPPDAAPAAAPAPQPAVTPFTSTGAPAPTRRATGSPSLRPLRPKPDVRIKGVATSRGVQIELFTIRAPRAARIEVKCSGRGCPRRLPRRSGGLQRFPTLQRSLRVGAVIEAFITQRGTSGRYTRLEIRPNAAPRRTTRCVTYGSTRPVRCPAG